MHLRDRRNRKENDDGTRKIPCNIVTRKRLRCLQCKQSILDEFSGYTRNVFNTNLMSLPREIQLIILSFLGPRELDAMRHVSKHFEFIVRDATLWKEYEILDRKTETSDIITDLKRMPLLKKITIHNRNDCDQILRQISLSNTNLEQLYVTNCTGSLLSLYLNSGYLSRLLERCNRLHTINFNGTQFRGFKFYRQLGKLIPRFRNFTATTTRTQLKTLISCVEHVAEKDRELITTLCSSEYKQNWITVKYFSPNNQNSGFFYIGFHLLAIAPNTLVCFVRPR